MFCLFFLFYLILPSRFAFSQNDDNKDVEWSANDPRWETKIPNWWDEENFKPPVGPIEEWKQDFWMSNGQKLLDQKLRQKMNTKKAKNLVIFIGDGMGLPSLMATRSYIGDVKVELSFEKFSHTGLAKTYCINYQVPDSACTASAILTGVKCNYGTIAVTGDVNLRDCNAQQDESSRTHSIFKHAQADGRATGIITTTRVTHATPAAAYASSASRYWESDSSTPQGCEDIAHQLIHGDIGSKLDVILGGGEMNFVPTETSSGSRTDGRNLITEYRDKQKSLNKRAAVVYNKVSVNPLFVAFHFSIHFSSD